MVQNPSVLVLDRPIPREELRRLVDEGFGDMVKYVVDVERGIVAVGGQLHADAEAALLTSGSRQEALRGANYYPGTGKDLCIEFTSLINIRPAQSNPGMEIADPTICDKVRDLTYRLIGKGEDL